MAYVPYIPKKLHPHGDPLTACILYNLALFFAPLYFIVFFAYIQWRNYVRRGEAAASGRQAAEDAAEFNQNY